MPEKIFPFLESDASRADSMTLVMKDLYVSPKRIAVLMSLIVLALIAAGILGQYYKFFVGDDPFLLKIVDKIDLDGETNNLPNWYQSSTLLLSSFILGIIALLKKSEKNADFRCWGFLSLIFLYLSLDELVSIHEQATLPLRYAFDLNGYFYLSWVIPGAIVVVLFFFAYLKFLLRLDFRTRFLFVAAGTVYVFGALVIEMFDGSYLERHEAKISGITISSQIAFNYSLMTAAEEFFEMAGIILFVYALLSYLMPAPERSAAPVSVKAGETHRAKMKISEPAVIHLQIK